MKVDYSFVRKNKAAELKERAEYTFVKKKLTAETYFNATILPLKKFKGDTMAFGRGGVIDDSGNYIRSSGISESVIYYGYEFENPVFMDQKVVFLGYLNDQWGHFLVDAITRIWYYLKNDKSVDKYVFYTKEGKEPIIGGNYKKFFQLYNIYDKIEVINSPTKYREVVIPEMGYKRYGWYSEEYKSIFRKLGESVINSQRYCNIPSAEKVFLSRSQLQPVREFGLGMLDDLFQKNGYKVIYPEKTDLAVLIYLLNQAKVVATMDGSIHHNILFARDNIDLIIVDRRVIADTNEIEINRFKDLSVTFVDANLPIYMVDIKGPYILYCNNYLENYCRNNRWKMPEDKYLSEKYRKKLLKQYLKSYQNMYGRRWCILEWYERLIGQFSEGYADSYKYYGKYLTKEKLLYFSDLFEIEYWKRMIKKFFNKR